MVDRRHVLRSRCTSVSNGPISRSPIALRRRPGWPRHVVLVIVRLTAIGDPPDAGKMVHYWFRLAGIVCRPMASERSVVLRAGGGNSAVRPRNVRHAHIGGLSRPNPFEGSIDRNAVVLACPKKFVFSCRVFITSDGPI
jgi:hypothetical protein